MRKLTLTIGIAVLAAAFPGANASEGSEYERAARPRAAPYEETEFDRTQPTISQRMERPRRPRGEPYQDVEIDQTLPDVRERAPMVGEASTGASGAPESAWDRDHNFVAPPQ